MTPKEPRIFALERRTLFLEEQRRQIYIQLQAARQTARGLEGGVSVGCLVIFDFTVTDSSTSAAISGATVTLYDPNGYQVGSGVTDGSGELTLYGFAPGTYTYRSSASGYPDAVNTQAATCASTYSIGVAMTSAVSFPSNCPCYSTTLVSPITMTVPTGTTVSTGGVPYTNPFSDTMTWGDLGVINSAFAGTFGFISNGTQSTGFPAFPHTQTYHEVITCVSSSEFNMSLYATNGNSFGLPVNWLPADAGNNCSPFSYATSRGASHLITLLP